MPTRIPQSIAIRVPLKGYLSSDHLSDATSLDPAVVISKNGAGFTNPAAGATVATEVGSGWYYVDLATGDVDTLGPLIVRATHATMDAIEIAYHVVNPNTMGAAALPNAAADAAGGLAISDAGALDLDVKLANTNEVTAARMGALTDLINGGRLDLLIDAIKAKTDYLPDEAPSTLAEMVTAIDASAVLAKEATLGAPAGASVSVDLAAIKALLPGLALTTGTVLTSGGNNTATSFYTDLAGGDDFWKDCLILITSGALAGQVKRIGAFADTNGVVTLVASDAFTGTPADGVTFAIINR